MAASEASPDPRLRFRQSGRMARRADGIRTKQTSLGMQRRHANIWQQIRLAAEIGYALVLRVEPLDRPKV